MLCCLAALAALSPIGGWLIARRGAAAGAVCCQQDSWKPAALLATGVGAACVAGYLLMSTSPQTFRPICSVLLSPAAWPRF